jgi:hypothetical protein
VPEETHVHRAARADGVQSRPVAVAVLDGEGITGGTGGGASRPIRRSASSTIARFAATCAL